MMQNYVAGDHSVVYLADGQPMDIVGIGDVQIKIMNGSIWNLQNVRFADIIASIEAENQAQLCHYRLGHMSQKGIKILQSKGKLPKLKKNVDIDICESCIPGKQKKLIFIKVGKTLRSRKLELVNTDLWEPSSVASWHLFEVLGII